MYKRSDTLFTIKDWKIMRYGPDGKAYGHHINCKRNLRNPGFSEPEEEIDCVDWGRIDDPVCHYCNQDVPEEIQALIHLNEWDTPDA